MPVIQRFFAAGGPPQITVTFTYNGPNTPPSWSFSPDSLEMHGNGTIQFVLSSDSTPGAAFSGFGIKTTSPNPNNGTFDNINVIQNGQRMNVNDHNNVPVGGMPLEFDYTIGVTYSNTTYYSDPKIINDPPPEMYRMVKVSAAATARA